MVIAVKTNPLRCMMEKSTSNSEELKTNPENNYENSNCCDCASAKSLATGKQEFVVNCKEFRIDNNKTHLKIIGNCNKIRLLNNTGHLEVIGNSTRVKIVKNSGTISYTGNCGKVYLGRDSSNKHVDYIGNSGILKIVPEDSLNVDCNKNKSEIYEKIHLGGGRSAAVKGEQNRSPRSSVKIEAGTTTEIHFDPSGALCLQLSNNISMPNNMHSVNYLNGSGGGGSSTVQIASGATNIVVNSTYQA